MRLTQKKIEEILVDILGEEALSLIRYLSGRENVSEFDLANKTKKDIKVVRRMLYILYNNNLVSFTRKKDKQKGWYIYYWTLILDSIKYVYYKKKKEHLAHLEARLEEETKELFFICSSRCVRLNFDQAMDIEFHCPECGELVLQDSSEKNVADLKKELKAVSEEVEKLEKEKRKVIARRAARRPVEEEEPKKKVVKKTTKKTPAKKKVAKKPAKKVVKKKPVKKPAKKVAKKPAKKSPAKKKPVKKTVKKKVKKK